MKVYVLDGEPRSFKTPATNRYTKVTYNPMAKLKEAMSLSLLAQRPINHEIYENQPVHADVVFYMQRPKTGKYKNHYYHIIRPDADNLEKLLFDAAKNILFKDDCLIASKNVKKIYSNQPRIEFSIRSLKDENAKKEQS